MTIRQLAIAALMLSSVAESFSTPRHSTGFIRQQQRMAPVLRDAETLVDAASPAPPEIVDSVVDSVQSAAVVTPPPPPTTPTPIDFSDGVPPLSSVAPDLDTIALVAGQENYGLAVVVVGEALWSFFQAPSLDHAKILVPAIIAALVLGFVSGPMITSGDPASVSTGLFIATGVSLGLGASYVARLLAPFSPSSKEIAALGLLVAVAGFFSFSQNLIVDGFVTLPSIPLPSLPEITLPSIDL